MTWVLTEEPTAYMLIWSEDGFRAVIHGFSADGGVLCAGFSDEDPSAS